MKTILFFIGYDVPLAIDHFGHVCVEDCIRFARRMEPYNLAWIEDMVPWMYTDQYVRLKNSTTIPVCTGEDIYLKEGFETLIKAGGVSVIHPDILTCGGALELKKIADKKILFIGNISNTEVEVKLTDFSAEITNKLLESEEAVKLGKNGYIIPPHGYLVAEM